MMRSVPVLMILALCWVSLVYVQYLFSDPWPSDVSVVWVLLAFAAILPLVAAHATVWFPRRASGALTWFLLQFALAFVSISIAEQFDRTWYDLRNFSHLSTAGYLGAVLVFVVQRRIFPQSSLSMRTREESNSQKQFSIRNLAVWITLAAIIMAFAPNAWRMMRASADNGVSAIPIGSAGVIAGVYFATTAFVYLPLFQFLSHAKRPVLAAVSLVVFSFLLTTVVALSYLSYEQSYGSQDAGWFVAVVIAAPIATAIFCTWFFTIRWNNREDAIKVNPNKASLFSKFALFVENSLLLVTICFFVYSIGWGARHFVFPGSYGDPTILQTSLAMKKQVARVCSRDGLIDHESLSGDEDLLELKNRLSGASVPPDQNAIYQIAGLSNLEFLDGKGDGQEYRLALGFSRKQIENLPDTQLILWLNQQRPDFVDNDVSPEKQWVWDSTLKNENQIRDFLQNATNREIAYLMHYANWNAAELPIATQYCKEMQSVFQAIRLATRCQFAFSPVSHADNTDEFVRFAHEMLVIDSHYQVGIGNLDRVIENCESLFRFSELLSKEAPIVVRSPILVLSRMRGDALSVAQRALTHKSCTRSQAERIRGLLNQEIDYAQLSERSNILNFAYWNCEAGNRLRNGSSSDFVLNFHFYGMVEFPFLRTYFHQPQMIDWGEFTQVGIEVLENHADFLRSTNFGLSDVKALDVYVEKLNSPLDEDTPTDSAIAFALGPKTKGRQLGLWAGRSCSAGLLDAEFSYVLRNRIRRAKIAILVEKKMRGRLPGDLSQFLSEDSDGLFLDPYSGKELIYGEDKASDVGFTIYSVGRNGVDDGGQGGDVTLAYSDFAPSTIDYLKTEF